MVSPTVLTFKHGRVERKRLYGTTNEPQFFFADEIPEWNNTGGPRHVPGIHVAINFERLRNIQFAHGFGFWKQERLSSREISLLQFINKITDSTNWYNDVFNLSIATRWKQLATAQYGMDTPLWEWCLFELINKAREFAKDSQRVFVFDSASRVSKSDRLVNTALFAELRQSTHGRLVSPWLYPFIYGRSPIKADGTSIGLDNVAVSIGRGTIPSKPFWDTFRWSGERQYYSKRSQWLATDIEFTGKGNAVRFSSPVNNLHPLQLKSVYAALETLIPDCIAEWNDVLLYKWLHRNGPRMKPQQRQCYACTKTTGGPCFCIIEFHDFAEWKCGNVGPGTQSAPENPDCDPVEYLLAGYKNNRKLYESISLGEAFKDEGLQIYVELARIEVRPDGTTSPEDSRRFEWCLNGNRNERIVASTLLCLRRENLQDHSGGLSFRSETRPGAWEVDGSPSPGPGHPSEPHFQEMGTVELREGRIITFPNVLQHRFERMQLRNECEPGSLQFLAIHLADPHYILCSTRHVPPQSVGWWWQAANLDLLCAHHRVPFEIKRYIVDYALGVDCGSTAEVQNAEEEAASICRTAQDNAPEMPQEERPMRIELALRIRQGAIEEHRMVMEHLNNLRVYGVPENLRRWYRKAHPEVTVPLDHSDPSETGYAVLDAPPGVVSDNGTDEDSGDDEIDSDSDDEAGVAGVGFGGIAEESDEMSSEDEYFEEANAEEMEIHDMNDIDSGHGPLVHEDGIPEQAVNEAEVFEAASSDQETGEQDRANTWTEDDEFWLRSGDDYLF